MGEARLEVHVRDLLLARQSLHVCFGRQLQSDFRLLEAIRASFGHVWLKRATYRCRLHCGSGDSGDVRRLLEALVGEVVGAFDAYTVVVGPSVDIPVLMAWDCSLVVIVGQVDVVAVFVVAPAPSPAVVQKATSSPIRLRLTPNPCHGSSLEGLTWLPHRAGASRSHPAGLHPGSEFRGYGTLVSVDACNGSRRMKEE